MPRPPLKRHLAPNTLSESALPDRGNDIKSGKIPTVDVCTELHGKLDKKRQKIKSLNRPQN